MAQLMRGLSRYEHGSPPQQEINFSNQEKIKELENRVQQLEELVDRLIKSKNPSFMDFKFIKEEDKRLEMERQSREDRRRMLERLRMFSR